MDQFIDTFLNVDSFLQALEKAQAEETGTPWLRL